MKEFKILLSSFEAVQEFVDLSTKEPYPIRVVAEERQINAKSLLGFFSMEQNTATPMTVQADCGDRNIDPYLKAVKRFMV